LKRKFTDKFVKSLRAAPPGKRVEHWDSAVQNFGVRVTDKGRKTYVLYLRWPGSRTPTRREIGNASILPLATARTKAREWRVMVELGIDPKAKERTEEIEAQRKKQTTFRAVAEAWFEDSDVKKQRKAAEVQTDVRREFVAPWGTKPITEITTLDVANIIKAKKAKGGRPPSRFEPSS
jgi:hypothetical protein